VVEVQQRSDEEVLVVVQLDAPPGFHDREACICVRTPDGRWYEAGSTGS